MQAFLLSYDIPTTPNPRDQYPNPSPSLRRRAVRIELSFWLVLENRIPWNMLNDMTESGVTWHLHKFDASEGPALLALAQTALVKQIKDAQARAAKSINRAEKTHDKSDKPERNETFLASCRAVLKRTEKLLADLCKAADAFGINHANLPTDTAMDAVNQIKATAEARALCYASMTEAVAGTDMAETARQDAIPAAILADYIEDQGGDPMEARSLFDEKLGEWVVPTE